MDKYQQLEKLAELKSRGALSEEEFTAQKARLLEAEAPVATEIGPIPQTNENSDEKKGTYWLPIPSLVLGIFSCLMLLDDSEWDTDTVNGLILFSVIGLTLGIISLSMQPKGRGMAIAGIVLGTIAGLCGLGLLVE